MHILLPPKEVAHETHRALPPASRLSPKRMKAADELDSVIADMQPGTFNWASASNHYGVIFLETALKFKGKQTIARLEKARTIFESALNRLFGTARAEYRAMMSSNLSNTLIALSDRRKNPEFAKAAYEHAMQATNYYDPYVNPWEWAYSIGNRGVARVMMAEFAKKPEWRKQAIEDLKAASKMMRKQHDSEARAYFQSWIQRASAPINKKQPTITL